jgi:hypothetical protein
MQLFLFFSKANLEVEIIIYRQLLDAAGIEVTSTVVPHRVQPVGNKITANLILKGQRRGSISISK